MIRRLNVIGADIDPDNPLGLHEEDGWAGAFSRQHAPGAIPNGARIRKARCEDGDTMPLGALGRVLGSVRDPDHPTHPGVTFYFVEWDDLPRIAIGVVETKIAQEATA